MKSLKKKNISKRITSCFLAAVMVLTTVVPSNLSVSAAELDNTEITTEYNDTTTQTPATETDAILEESTKVTESEQVTVETDDGYIELETTPVTTEEENWYDTLNTADVEKTTNHMYDPNDVKYMDYTELGIFNIATLPKEEQNNPDFFLDNNPGEEVYYKDLSTYELFQYMGVTWEVFDFYTDEEICDIFFAEKGMKFNSKEEFLNTKFIKTPIYKFGLYYNEEELTEEDENVVQLQSYAQYDHPKPDNKIKLPSNAIKITCHNFAAGYIYFHASVPIYDKEGKKLPYTADADYSSSVSGASGKYVITNALVKPMESTWATCCEPVDAQPHATCDGKWNVWYYDHASEGVRIAHASAFNTNSGVYSNQTGCHVDENKIPWPASWSSMESALATEAGQLISANQGGSWNSNEISFSLITSAPDLEFLAGHYLASKWWVLEKFDETPSILSSITNSLETDTNLNGTSKAMVVFCDKHDSHQALYASKLNFEVDLVVNKYLQVKDTVPTKYVGTYTSGYGDSVTFILLDENKNEINRASTKNNDGKATFKLLPGVQYYLREQIENGSKIETKDIPIKITDDTTIHVTNYSKPISFSIDKIDNVTKAPVEGARYAIVYKENASNPSSNYKFLQHSVLKLETSPDTKYYKYSPYYRIDTTNQNYVVLQTDKTGHAQSGLVFGEKSALDYLNGDTIGVSNQTIFIPYNQISEDNVLKMNCYVIEFPMNGYTVPGEYIYKQLQIDASMSNDDIIRKLEANQTALDALIKENQNRALVTNLKTSYTCIENQNTPLNEGSPHTQYRYTRISIGKTIAKTSNNDQVDIDIVPNARYGVYYDLACQHPVQYDAQTTNYTGGSVPAGSNVVLQTDDTGWGKSQDILITENTKYHTYGNQTVHTYYIKELPSAYSGVNKTELSPIVYVVNTYALTSTTDVGQSYTACGFYSNNNYYSINSVNNKVLAFNNVVQINNVAPIMISNYSTNELELYAARNFVKTQLSIVKYDGNLEIGNVKSNNIVKGATYYVYEDEACTIPALYNYPNYINNANDYVAYTKDTADKYHSRDEQVKLYVKDAEIAYSGFFYPSTRKLEENSPTGPFTYYVCEEKLYQLAAFRDLSPIKMTVNASAIPMSNEASTTATAVHELAKTNARNYGYTRVGLRKVDGNLFENYNKVAFDANKKVLGIEGAEYTLYYYDTYAKQYLPVTYNYPDYIKDAETYAKITKDSPDNYHENPAETVKIYTDADGYAYSDIFYPTSSAHIEGYVQSGIHKDDPIYTFYAVETGRDNQAEIYNQSPKVYSTQTTYMRIYDEDDYNTERGYVNGDSAETQKYSQDKISAEMMKKESSSYFWMTIGENNVYPKSRVVVDETCEDLTNGYTYIGKFKETNSNYNVYDYAPVGLRIEKLNGNVWDVNSNEQIPDQLWVDGAVYTVYNSLEGAQNKSASAEVKYNYPDYIKNPGQTITYNGNTEIPAFLYPSITAQKTTIKNQTDLTNITNAYLHYTNTSDYLEAIVNGEVDKANPIMNEYRTADDTEGNRYTFKEENGVLVLDKQSTDTVTMTTISDISDDKDGNLSKLSFSGWFFPTKDAEVELREENGYYVPYFTYYIRETSRINGTEATYNDLNPSIYKVVVSYNQIVEITECNNITLGNKDSGTDNMYYADATTKDTTTVTDYGWIQAKIQKRDKITLNPLAGAEYTLYYFEAAKPGDKGDDLIVKDGVKGRFKEVTYNYPSYITDAKLNTKVGLATDPRTMYETYNESKTGYHDATDVVKMTSNESGWAISDAFYPSYDAEHVIKDVDTNGDGVNDKTLVYFTYYVKETVTPRNYYNEQNIPSLQFFSTKEPITIIHRLVATTYCYDKSDAALAKNKSTYNDSTKQVIDMYGNTLTITTHTLGKDGTEAQQIAEAFIDGKYNPSAITNNGMAVTDGRIYNTDGDMLEDVYDYNELYQNESYRGNDYKPVYESEDFPVRGWIELFKEDSYLQKYTNYVLDDVHKQANNEDEADKTVLGHDSDKVQTDNITSGTASLGGSKYQLVAASTIKHPDGQTTGAQMSVSSATEKGVIYNTSVNLADCDPIITSKIVGYNTDTTGRATSPIYEVKNATGIYATNEQGYLQIGSSDENEWDADDLWIGEYYLYEIPAKVLVSSAESSQGEQRQYLVNENGYYIDNAVYKITVTYQDSNTKKVKATVEKCSFESGIVYDASSPSQWKVTGTIPTDYATTACYTNQNNVVELGPNGYQGNDTVLVSTETPMLQKFSFFKYKRIDGQITMVSENKLAEIHFYVKNRLDLGRYVVTNIHGQPLDEDGKVTTDPEKYVVKYVHNKNNNVPYDVVFDYYSLDRNLRTDNQTDAQGKDYEDKGRYYEYNGFGIRSYANVEVDENGEAVKLHKSNEYKKEYLMEMSEILLNQYPNLVIDGVETVEVNTQFGANMDMTRKVVDIDMNCIGQVNANVQIANRNEIVNPLANSKILVDDEGCYHLGLPQYDYADNYSPNDEVFTHTYDIEAGSALYGQFEYWSTAINYGTQMLDTPQEVEVVTPIGEKVKSTKDILKQEYLNENNSALSEEEKQMIADINAKYDNALKDSLSFTSKAEYETASITLGDRDDIENINDNNGLFYSIPLPYGVYAVQESGTDALEVRDKFDLTQSMLPASTFDMIINEESIEKYGAYDNNYTINPNGTEFGVKANVLVENGPTNTLIKLLKRDALTGEEVLMAGAKYQIYKINGDYAADGSGEQSCRIELMKYYTWENNHRVQKTVWETDANGQCIILSHDQDNAFESGDYLVVEVGSPEGYYIANAYHNFKYVSQNALLEHGRLIPMSQYPDGTLEEEQMTDFYGMTDGLDYTFENPNGDIRLNENIYNLSFNVSPKLHAEAIDKVEEADGMITLEFSDKNKPIVGIIKVTKKGPFLTGYNATNYTTIKDSNDNIVYGYENLPLHKAPAWLTFTYEEQNIPGATFNIYSENIKYSLDHQYRYDEVQKAFGDWEISYQKILDDEYNVQDVTMKYSDYDDIEKFKKDFIQYAYNTLTEDELAQLEQYRTYATYVNSKGEIVLLDEEHKLIDTVTTIKNNTKYYDGLSEEVITVERGTAYTGYLPLDNTYTIEEIQAPNGYVLQENTSDRTKSITLNMPKDENGKVVTDEIVIMENATFNNERQEYIFNLKKANAFTNEPIANATFTLYNSQVFRASYDPEDIEGYSKVIFPDTNTMTNAEMCDYVQSVLAEVVIDRLSKDYGTFDDNWDSLREEEKEALITNAIEEWNEKPESERIAIIELYLADDDGKSAEYILDPELKERLANAFACYYEQAIETQTTDENGMASFAAQDENGKSTLPAGRYHLHEDIPVPGYYSLSDYEQHNITFNPQWTVENATQKVVEYEHTVKNIPTVVAFDKVNFVSGESISGAHLEILEPVVDKNGNYVVENGVVKTNPVKSVYIDENGKTQTLDKTAWVSDANETFVWEYDKQTYNGHKVMGLEVGKTYIIRETKTPNGFIAWGASSEECKKANNYDETYKEVFFTVQDAEYDDEGKIISPIQVVTLNNEERRLQITVNKYASVTNAIAGIDNSLTSNPGYLKDENGRLYKPVYDANNLITNMLYLNYSEANIVLSGIEFEIIATKDIYALGSTTKLLYKQGTVIETITTNDQGMATTSELPFADYTIHEVHTYKPFVLMPDYYVKVDELKVDENPTSPVYYTNVGLENVLAQDAFEVSKEPDVDYFNQFLNKGEEPYTKEEILEKYDLSGAKYGIYAGCDIYAFSVKGSNEIEFPNSNGEKETVTVSYISDIEGLVLIAKKGDLLEVATAQKDGLVEFKYDYPTITFVNEKDTNGQYKTMYCDYYIQEIEAPKGWYLDPNRYHTLPTYNAETAQEYIHFDDGNDKLITDFELVSPEKIVLVEVSKLITEAKYENDKITPIKTDEFAKGATLRVVDEDGNVMDEWVTDGSKHYVRMLELDKEYTLEEVKPAPGFASAQPIKFIVPSDSATITLPEEVEEDIDTATSTDASNNGETTNNSVNTADENELIDDVDVYNLKFINEDGTVSDLFDGETFEIYATNISSDIRELVDTIQVQDSTFIVDVSDEDYKDFVIKGTGDAEFADFEILINGNEITINWPSQDYEDVIKKLYKTDTDIINVELSTNSEKDMTNVDYTNAVEVTYSFVNENHEYLHTQFDQAIFNVYATNVNTGVDEWIDQVKANGKDVTIKTVDEYTDYTLIGVETTNKIDISELSIQITDREGVMVECIDWAANGLKNKEYNIIRNELIVPEFDLSEVIVEEGKIEIEIPSITMYDQELVLDVSKIDITTNKELPGATLQIIKPDGTIYDQWVSGDKPHVIKRIPDGKYTLREISSPEGYSIAEDIEFEVKDTEIVQKVVMKNDITHLHVSKVNITNKAELPGATLQIIKPDGTIYEEWVSTDKPHVVNKIPAGKYILREITAPKGYAKAEDVPFEITTKNNVIHTVTMEDQEIELHVSKVDITTKAELPGATLQIIAEDGTIYEEWVSTNEKHIIYGIPEGKYILRETIAPDGYVKAEEIEFEISSDKVVHTVTMEDDYTKLHISKQDITNKKELPGAHLQLLDSEGNVYEEWISTDEQHVIERIPVGTYTLIETSAPKGYKIAEKITFEVKETGEVQTVVMYDEIDDTKTGDTHELPMEYMLMAVLSSILAAYAINKKKKLNTDETDDSNESEE